MSISSSPLSSPLSSPPPTDEEDLLLDNLSEVLSRLSTPPAMPSAGATSKPVRQASPLREKVLADNPDIAFIVMFRSRFGEAFSTKLPNYGPQDIERGVVDSTPSPQLEALLCSLLGLVLNRKKPVENGHYNRALEDAISSHRSQWPIEWNKTNPIGSGRNFNSMNPDERLVLLRTLILWSMNSSEIVSGIIKEKYKQSRQEDDLNQELSVQPWGKDGLKRKYWLIEGRDDTSFRLYRETHPGTRNHTWYSVAGSIDELKEVATKLDNDGSQAAKRLSARIMASMTRFEATEEKRKRREYRQAQKARWIRPEPGFSLYEGRTRGKRMRYTYSDNEDVFDSETTEPRRSTRNTRSGHINEDYSEGSDAPPIPANGRATRNSRRLIDSWGSGGDDFDGENDMDDEGDAASSNHSEEWQGEDEMEEMDEDDGVDADSESVTSELDELDLSSPKSLVVKLSFSERSSMDRLRQIEAALPPSAKEMIVKENAVKQDAIKEDPMVLENQPPIKNGSGPQPADVDMHQDEIKPSSPGASRPDFSKFLYTPPSQDTEPVHTGSGALEASSPAMTHPKPNGITVLAQHPPPSTTHFQNTMRMPTPPHTAQPPDSFT